MNIESPSYLKIGFHAEGKNYKELRVPTFWDATEKQWIAVIKTPLTKHLVSATGKDSLELQNNFNLELKKIIGNPKYAKEVSGMFEETGE